VEVRLRIVELRVMPVKLKVSRTAPGAPDESAVISTVKLFVPEATRTPRSRLSSVAVTEGVKEEAIDWGKAVPLPSMPHAVEVL
jgi:hypothetical protein